MKRIRLLLVFICCIILSACSGTGANKAPDNTRFTEHDDGVYKLQTFASAVKTSCGDCKTLGGRFEAIWSDCINKNINYETLAYTVKDGKFRDFNEALVDFARSEEYDSYGMSLLTDKGGITDLYSMITSLPSDFDSPKVYAKEIFDAFSLYYENIVTPSGSLVDYRAAMKDYTAITTKCDTLLSILPSYEISDYALESETIYASFSFGLRKGVYTGHIVSGYLNGKGSFSSANTAGNGWTYTGDFAAGNFHGHGETIFDDGTVQNGTFKYGSFESE